MDANIIMKRIALFSILGLFVFSFVPSAMAQRPPNGPEGDQPGAQASRFQSDAELAKSRVEKKAVKKPQISMEGEKAKPEAEAGPSFTLKDIVITGSTVFKPEELKSVYGPYLGKEVAYKDINEIVEKIKDEYKKKGNFTTIVYIPEQNIVDGKLEIRASEGKTGEVNIEGNKWFSASMLRNYIHAKKNELLNIFKLERDILRINQNADLEAKVVLAPGKEPGTSDITIKVADKFPHHVGTSVDNQGTRLVGKYRNSFSYRSSNMLGFADTAYYSTIMSATSSGNYATYTIPIDTYGTKAAFDFTQFYSKLGQELKGFDITGNTEIYTPHIIGEIYLSDMLQVNIDTGLEIKSIKKNIDGEKSSNDQLRLFYVAYDITRIDSILGGGQTSFSPRVTFSTEDFLGASRQDHPSASRSGTGGVFVKYEQNLRRYQKLPFESYMIMRSQFQFASHSLPPSEQMQLGGSYTVRGYPEGDYTADYGATLNMDWYFPCYLIPKEWKLPKADQPLRNQIEPVAFFDMGGGGLMRVNPGEYNGQFLMGVGGGLKLHFNRNVFLRMDWAEPLGGDLPAQGNGPSTFYLTLQCEV